MLENPMANERPIRYIPYQAPLTVEDECRHCEERAQVKINGQKYCWNCAECEGVERIG